MDRGAVSDALSWWGIIWSARPARVPRGAHRHRAARARHGEFGDIADPQQRQPELQVGGVAYRCPIEFRHQVARLEPGTLGRRLRIDLEDDCSGRSNPFWTLVPRLRPSQGAAFSTSSSTFKSHSTRRDATRMENYVCG